MCFWLLSTGMFTMLSSILWLGLAHLLSSALGPIMLCIIPGLSPLLSSDLILPLSLRGRFGEIFLGWCRSLPIGITLILYVAHMLAGRAILWDWVPLHLQNNILPPNPENVLLWGRLRYVYFNANACI